MKSLNSVNVAISRCPSYGIEEVRPALHDCLSYVGGLQRFVSPGDRVLIKPNLLLATQPQRAITTHPVILQAIVEEVRECGATAFIGDSPGAVLKGLERVWRKTGLLELAQCLDVELLNFEKGGIVQKTVHGRMYPISKYVQDSDVIINVPKLKTHNVTLFTGAIKNLLGCLPGLTKANLHKNYPNPRSFAGILVDILEIVRPNLNVMDGIWGMDGDGPSTRGRKREIGVIMASVNAVSLDAVSAEILGFESRRVDTIRIAHERNLGEIDTGMIRLSGGDLSEYRLDDPSLPGNWKMLMVPDWLGHLVGRFIWVHPVVDPTRCVLCGQCEASCPAGAISIVEDELTFDYTKCINCLCCQEMCGEGAIRQTGSYLSRMIHRNL
jgi:uncharacterized protein (DUF362 family)/Pyruvate/2-oxoacid:ferredoxin oxidoreductase delta subunit